MDNSQQKYKNMLCMNKTTHENEILAVIHMHSVITFQNLSN